jgi:hypothetical protein
MRRTHSPACARPRAAEPQWPCGCAAVHTEAAPREPSSGPQAFVIFWILSKFAGSPRARKRLWMYQYTDNGTTVVDHTIAMLLGLVSQGPGGTSFCLSVCLTCSLLHTWPPIAILLGLMQRALAPVVCASICMRRAPEHVFAGLLPVAWDEASARCHSA